MEVLKYNTGSTVTNNKTHKTPTITNNKTVTNNKTSSVTKNKTAAVSYNKLNTVNKNNRTSTSTSITTNNRTSTSTYNTSTATTTPQQNKDKKTVRTQGQDNRTGGHIYSKVSQQTNITSVWGHNNIGSHKQLTPPPSGYIL